MLIREARPQDYEAAGRVTQAAWREFEWPADPIWAEYFARLGDVAGRAERALVLVALERGMVVGTATVELESTVESGGTLEPDHANFRMLAVAPAWRGRGVGRRLVEECIARARGVGKSIATLHTAEEMVAALAIYGSLGFERDPAGDYEPASGHVLRAYRLELAAVGRAGS